MTVTTVSKPVLVKVLRRRNLHDRAEWVQRQMPDVIDLERNASLLDLLGLDAEALTAEKPTP